VQPGTAVVTSTARAKLAADTADTAVVFVAIEADVMELRDETGGGAPRSNRHRIEIDVMQKDCE
jgi:hypothetical protein